MSSDGSSRRPHVALFAFPFASHPGNLFTFARMLAAAAAASPPAAAFSFFTSAQSRASLADAPRPDNIRLYDLDDGTSGAVGPPASVLERIGLFIKAMPANLKAGVEVAVRETEGLEVSCVVSDAFLWVAGDVAEEMGVPWVPLWTCGPAALLAHLYTDQLRLNMGVLDQDDASIPGKLDEPVHCIPSLSALRICDLPQGILFGDIHSDFPILLHRAGNKLPAAAALAINTFQGLSPDIDSEFSSIFKQFLPIGPFHLLSAPPPAAPQDDECLAWLDRQGPATVAYVSFGTVMMPPPAELEELARGLEASGAPFLWSLKEKAREGLPAGFLDRTRGRGLVVAWAPQVRVLGHGAVGAFVTHCGWNSITESIASGVPMACRPFFGDQKTNARMVSHVWRFGVAFEGGGAVRKEEMERVLNVMLREEEGRRMRERVGELKEVAAEAARPGGRSGENMKSVLKIVCGV